MREALGVVVAVTEGTTVGVTEGVREPEGVLDGAAPVEKVAVVEEVTVRGQQAAAEVEPVELVVKPAPQEVHVESPVVAA